MFGITGGEGGFDLPHPLSFPFLTPFPFLKDPGESTSDPPVQIIAGEGDRA